MDKCVISMDFDRVVLNIYELSIIFNDRLLDTKVYMKRPIELSLNSMNCKEGRSDYYYYFYYILVYLKNT